MSGPGGFFTAINCMDGRVQLPVIKYLMDRFGVDYVDSVTEPGPNGILAAGRDAASGGNSPAIESIMQRVRISVEQHGSAGIAVVGHHDCAGNPAPREKQREQTMAAIGALRARFPGVAVVGLWVDEAWEVSEEATGITEKAGT